MKRFQFLAGLFGFGAAAQVVSQRETPKYETMTKLYASDGAGTVMAFIDGRGNGFLGKSKPVNNQCPVCGTMAEPYHYVATPCNVSPSIAPGSTAVPAICITNPDLKPSITTRCKQCNVAFYQDAE